MCGIIAYTGNREAAPLLIDGLRHLEYRGYDSAGVAIRTDTGLHVRKRAGRIRDLAELLARQPAPGLEGIGHTRWATHGPATDVNAHPHLSDDGTIAVVHNGVIENHVELRHELQAQGVTLRSETDTEVIAHLIAAHLEQDLVHAVQQALTRVKGTYGLAVVSRRHPGLVVGARLGSPLVIGVGPHETFLASDPGALVGFTDRVVYLTDRQLCRLGPGTWQVIESGRPAPSRAVELPDPGTGTGDLTGFPHYMMKEIVEQPRALANALRGRLDDHSASAHFGGLNLSAAQLRQVDRIVLTGCGTSYHAALVGEYLLEEFARIPVEVEYASEFRYRNPPLDRHTIVIALTQSGETADTLAAVEESKRKGQPTLAICNVVGSSIARAADGGVYLHAGPEIGVASTKAFTSQVLVLALLALYFGRMRHLSRAQGERMVEDLRQVPEAVRQVLDCGETVRRLAEKYAGMKNFLYLGRQYLYPVALEGALKLKETSYLHAEGFPAAEMKHGPIAMVDRETAAIFLVPRGSVFSKIMSNLEEIKARGGRIIAIGNPADPEVTARADDVIAVPEVPEYLQPLVVAVPLQLFAYHMALRHGCDVDKPRNLAKSVTVE